MKNATRFLMHAHRGLVRLVLIVLVGMMISLPARAQTRIGFIGHVTMGNATVDPPVPGLDFKTRTTFGFGGVLDVGLSKNLSLHLEPSYMQSGSIVEAQGQQVDEIKTDYLSLPILVKYAIGAGAVRPYVMGGLNVLYRLKAEATIEGAGVIKDFDLLLGLGAGVSAAVGTKVVFIEGRYAHGLVDIANGPQRDIFTVKSKAFQVIAGITFPLGGR